MNYSEIVQILAPCGLDCTKCMGYKKGDIAMHSRALRNALGNFEGFARKFALFQPIFAHYPQFKMLLDHFSEGSCGGCRQGECVNGQCQIHMCHQNKNIDFCFQCEAFPCSTANLDSHLEKKWLAMNTRMKEIGVENYYEETKDTPRYS